MLRTQLIQVLIVVLILGINVWFLYKQLPYKIRPMEQASRQIFRDEDVEPIVKRLVERADKRHQRLFADKPATLSEAVSMYKKKFKRLPPPHFDRWWDYCERNEVTYGYTYLDTINENLFPFWGLSPETLRRQLHTLEENLDKAFCSLTFEDGEYKIEGHDCYRVDNLRRALDELVTDIPNTQLIINYHDEPRVIIPYEERQKLIKKAQEDLDRHVIPVNPIPKYSKFEKSTNKADVIFEDHTHTNNYHLAEDACPPDSPANDPRGIEKFVSRSAIDIMKDPENMANTCQHPEFKLETSQYVCPNGGQMVRNLVPIFSDTKLTVFDDIVYPTGVYYTDFFFGQYNYDGSNDVDWEQKLPQMIYRGAANGGTHDEHNWYYMQRMRFALRVKADNNFHSSGLRSPELPDPKLEEFKKEYFNVSLSYLYPEYAKKHLPERDYIPMRDQFINKYFMDMDGYSDSPRIRALMYSKSLPFKACVWKTWHDSFVFPWYHYVPVDMSYAEIFILLGYFEGIDTRNYKLTPHPEIAAKIASQGREDSAKHFRYEDMRAYLHILILEYARLLDDKRDLIGFVDG